MSVRSTLLAAVAGLAILAAGCGGSGDELKASEATCADFNEASPATQERLVDEMFDAGEQKDSLPEDQHETVRDAILGGTRMVCPGNPDEPLMGAALETARSQTDTIGPIEAEDPTVDDTPSSDDQFLTPRAAVSFTYSGFDYEASVERSYPTVDSNALVSSARPGSTWLMIHVTLANQHDDRAVPVIYNPFLIHVGLRDAAAVSDTEKPCDGEFCSASTDLGSYADGELEGVPCSTCEIPAGGQTTLVIAVAIKEGASPEDVRLFMRDTPSIMTVNTPADGRLT